VHGAIATALDTPPPCLIASGMKAEDADDCARLYEQAGLAETRRIAAGGWATLILRCR
jgi:hypothetical protein